MQQFIMKKLSRLVAYSIGVAAILCSYSFAPAYHLFPSEFPGEKASNAAFSAIAHGVLNGANPSFIESKKFVYDSLHLEEAGLSRSVFELGLRGMEKLKRKARIQTNILSIVDFSKPSTSKRLFVIDLDNIELLFCTWVAHGRNSGKEWASSFSNKPRSRKSSLGFYVTGQPYMGSNGYSLKLFGVEQGINNNAYSRAIVLHGADYVNTDYINNQGYIGRSQGCPAVMPEVNTPLINTIKDGSCLFIYHPTPAYIKRSVMVK
jgi:hypothetical protein